MAYYEGPSLKQRIGSGPLPIREALAHFADVAEGLRRAHEARIVHRDIKPANVMLGERGQVKIVDFGDTQERLIYAIRLLRTDSHPRAAC
ncbi:MAG: protein kinase [Geminicoccaceae bacterium]|nr:protein kinase [Geminicoccaceae bacterium]